MASHKTSRTVLTLLWCCTALATAQTPDNQCFWKNAQSTVAEGDGWYACNNTAKTPGGASLCCIKGSECGEDSLCHYPSGSNGGSGWYLGGCTDGSYNDPVCPRACTAFHETWVQYNDTEQLWRCCGDDVCNGTPSSESFQAVAPDQWSALPSQATSTAGSSKTATATATTTGGSGSQNSGTQGKGNANKQDGNSNGGLSTGAQAGIGVGVTIVALALIGVIAFWLLRRRKSAKASVPSSDTEEQMTQSHKGAQNGYQHDYQYVAVPAYPRSPENQAQRENKPPLPLELSPEQRVELGDGLRSPQELASNEPRPAELGDNERR